MNELTFHPKKKITAAEVEKICVALELSITMKARLKSLPDNIHWHYKKGKEKGTLEITLLTGTNEIILTYKKNRSGDWISEAMKELEAGLNV